MAMKSAGEITELLKRRDEQSLAELFPIVYEELREIAGSLFRGEFRADHTLQPTALVHEAYLKLIGDGGSEREVSWQSRAHFFGIAARAMRQILVDHARRHNSEKRGGGETILALDGAVNLLHTQNIEILALHEALERLAKLDERQAEIIELRFFGGLTIQETAEVLQISTATIDREWEMARSWLYRELKTGK